jgi:hypothetical protein
MWCKVKIWEKELICDICFNNKWFKSTLKTEIARRNTLDFGNEVRYMFECKKCGNCRMFGMVSSEDDIDDVNITITPVDEN